MTRQLTATFFGLALLACCVTQADAQRWKYPPGPPYRSCPGTPTIFNVEQADTTLAPCHPATLDTVVGVRGIIIGMDQRPSAYGFYIENRFAGGSKPYYGVDVFTGATNYGSIGFAVGDSVSVTGTTQEFPNPNGTTELEGPDTFQNTDDIIITKISSGNPLPAAKVGTTHDFNWIPTSPGNIGEQWEGSLVRINGPLHVARVATGLGVQGNNFLIVSNATPADTVMIDGFTLFLFGTPPLNTAISFVQGILNQNTGAGVNSYRIQLRDANDISSDAPPNLVEAYPLENNKLRLLFDKNLDLTAAQDESNYSLASGLDGSTVDNATLVGGAGTTVELDITSVLNPGENESITAQDIGTSTCPLCVSPQQTLDFVQGITPLADETVFTNATIKGIQSPDPAFLSPCDDRSRFAGAGTAFGRRLTVRGVAVESFGSLYYIVDPAGGRRKGVSIFGPSTPLVNGHKYRIACRVQEFGGETEIVNTVNITDEGVVAVPAPSVQSVADLSDSTCDANQNRNTGEDWEGTLVQVRNVRVVDFNTPPTDPGPGGSFRVVQPANNPTAPDTILISAVGGNYTYDPTAGDVRTITGICHQDGSFRILPRNDADIAPYVAGVDGGSSLALALEVRPNPGTAHQLRFSLPRKDNVELSVYDLAGRKLATLAHGVMEAGVYNREWTGRGADGTRIGAGMYFYRLKVGSETRTMRGILLN